jgi:hypothetical protein
MWLRDVRDAAGVLFHVMQLSQLTECTLDAFDRFVAGTDFDAPPARFPPAFALTDA